LSDIIRFGVSIEQDLLENFDRIIDKRGYATRSEALRDLIRESLVEQKIETESETQVLGTLTIVYDHHASNLLQEMAQLQHSFHQLILSVRHLHDFSLAKRLKKWIDLNFSIDNVLNKRYFKTQNFFESRICPTWDALAHKVREVLDAEGFKAKK